MKKLLISSFVTATVLLLQGHTTAFAAQCGDVNDSDTVTASDALGVLKIAVGQPFDVDCGKAGSLLQTGQTNCYNGAGQVITCEGSGQDGEFQRGAPRSFRNNGNGTVTDRSTGLQWELLADDGVIHDKDDVYTWINAFEGKVAALNTANFAGHSDWRVPNAFELYSVVDFGEHDSALFDVFDSGCTDGCSASACSCSHEFSWSSTTMNIEKNKAWALNEPSAIYYGQLKTMTHGVRAVRGPDEIFPHLLANADDGGGAGVSVDTRCADVNESDSVTASDSLAVLKKAVGQPIELLCALPRVMLTTGQTGCYNAAGGVITCAGTGQDGELQTGVARSFVNNGNGTISDPATGLMWEVLSNDGALHDKDALYSWSGSFGKVAFLNLDSFAGFNDWRLPNFNELMTLLDLGEAVIAAYPEFKTACPEDCTELQCSCSPQVSWSSTTVAVNPGSAWSVFFYGDWGSAQKSSMFAVRAVRGGK